MGPLILTIIMFAAIVVLSLLGYYFWQKSQTKKFQEQRLESAINLQPAASENPDEEKVTKDGIPTVERKDKRYSTIPWVDDLLRNFFKKSTPALLRLIEQSGLSIKVSEFLLFTAILGFLGAAIVNFVVHIPLVGFGIAFIPFVVLKKMQEGRIAAFVKQMPPALDLLNSDLKAGLDIVAGLKHLADESEPPLSEEMGKLIVEINLGMPVGDALNNLAERIDTMDVQMLCTGISINREIGGNLSELITKVSATVRERFRLRGIIASLTAEGKMSAYLLLGLPFGLYALLNSMAPETYASFSSDPIGQQIIGGCLVSMTVGYFLINKIISLDI